jgi:hypothetical protein
MNPGIKKIFAYAPVVVLWGIDFWAASTGTYASERDKIFPYYFALLSFLYMLPAIIAAHRNHSNFLSLWIVDLFGTFLFLVGWFVALIWAFIDPKRKRAAPN